MIPLIVKIISYSFENNTCQAELQDKKIITLDPFVGCAIDLSDEEYDIGEKAQSIVGKSYLMSEYGVFHHCVIPNEKAFKEI